MLFFTLAFLAGELFLQLFSQLPAVISVFAVTVMGGFVCIFLRKHTRYWYLICAFMLGFLYCFWYAHSILAWTLPENKEGKPMLMTGYIVSLPVSDQWQTNFFFVPDNANTLIKLSVRDENMQLNVGDKWQFLVRLKRIHGTQNPGVFDYEAWALQKGLRASGYVVASKQNKFISHEWYRYPIAQLRQNLQTKIQSQMPVSAVSPWLMALIIGERNGIRQEDWQVLRNTGTNHLMAIAGLHIGIMAGFAHAIVSWLWRRIPRLVLMLPAQQAGACAALIIAIFYSALAGFSIPTQRACIMLSVFVVALLLRRKMLSWNAWALAMLIVLLMNPLSVLTESFWLSFGTIALIIYGMSARLAPTGLWWKWGRVQWVIGFGLIPLSLMLFQECSLVSFAANCIAIPWLGFFILPFCFLGGIFLFFSPVMGGFLLSIADKSLSGLWLLLSWFSHLNIASWHHAIPNVWVFFLTVFGFLLLLIPAGFPGRWLGVVWVFPLFFYKISVPDHGEYWLNLLDVGQGLSVVVQTKNHVLVYDAGPKFGAGFDTGESVVLPFLRTIDAKKIDKLVVSHGDNDHIGGVSALLKSLPITSINTSVPEKIPASQYCFAGDSWQWDGVTFSFLYPTNSTLELGNDSSCVLKIDNGFQRVLLTGDIEKFAEKELMMSMSDNLRSNIIVAPHHGSKTSAVKEFVSAVHPQYVLYATGYRNRYHFPHRDVISVYENIGAVQLNTAVTGAVQFKLQRNNMAPQPELYRVEHKRYWYS